MSLSNPLKLVIAYGPAVRRLFGRPQGRVRIATCLLNFSGLTDYWTARLHLWECLALIALYALYVLVVVASHWRERRIHRRARRESQSRNHFFERTNDGAGQAIRENSDPYCDSPFEPVPHTFVDQEGQVSAMGGHQRRSFYPKPVRDDSSARSVNDNTGAHEPFAAGIESLNPIRPSLVGALEFRALSWSLVRSRSQSSVSSTSLRSGQTPGRLDRNERPGGDEHSLRTPQRALSLRTPSPGSSSNALGQLGNAEARKRALSVNDMLSSRKSQTTNRPELELSGNPLQSEEEPTNIAEHAGLPSIILTEHEAHDRARPRVLPYGAATTTRRMGTFPSEIWRASDGTLEGNLDPHTEQWAGQRQNRLDLQDLRGSANEPSSNAEPGSGPVSPRSDEQHQGAPAFPSSDFAYHDRNSIPRMARPPEPFSRPNWWPVNVLPPPMVLCLTLFPTFVFWRRKNLAEKCLALVTAPSVFLLTVTVPVVDIDDTNELALQELYEDRIQQNGQCFGFMESTCVDVPYQDNPQEHPMPVPNGNDMAFADTDLLLETTSPSWRSSHQGVHGAPGNPVKATPDPPKRRRWLAASQLFTAPWLVVSIIWLNVDSPRNFWDLLVWLLCATIFALTLSVYGYHRSRRGKPWLPRAIPCILGFVVSVAWISTIAGEVVGVLKTIGVVFGISDALLGLTIFAIGNRYDMKSPYEHG